MTRVLSGICLGLAALCAVQWTTLARLKGDLAAADARATRRAFVDLADRQGEIVRAIDFLDSSVRTRAAAAGEGLCPGGRPDSRTIGTLLFGVYLRSRADGSSETQARERIVRELSRGSTEQH